ncbi:MAG: HAD hydrolase-like protein [Ignavibacteriae bacterium]|nr:HAD hydrolase-like protein [Ignavibacteriota bacterium]
MQLLQKPILIDLDGVLRIGNNIAEFAEEFLNFIESNKIPACILSNSSLFTSEQIENYFSSNNIEINIPIITAIDSAYDYLKRRYKKVAIYTSENVVAKFSEFLEYENPEAVLIGDIGENWNYKLMQTVFEYVRSGAELIAVHKNRFWNFPGKGIQLDAGTFIHGIEFAASTSATIIGKPSKIYFESALRKIGFDENTKFIMLGDDLETDMYGAKKIYAETILILTGKTKLPIPENLKIYVNHIAENLLDVKKILENV